MKGQRALFLSCFLYAVSCMLSSYAFAVPETAGVKITDVTPVSFSIVWMTDVEADPSVEVYRDSSMTERIIEGITITSMPGLSQEVKDAAKRKGIMKVMVSGLNSVESYFVRTVTQDPEHPESIGYSSLYGVVTASRVIPYKFVSGGFKGFSNDLASFKIYTSPINSEPAPGLGDLIILETSLSPYPMSAFVGDGINAPEGILDLNNLFNIEGFSMDTLGSEKIVLRIYRGGLHAMLFHYRKLPAEVDSVSVSEPIKGFFADINMDGKVDDEDFQMFRGQYRTLPSDDAYNPDYNFVDDREGRVDVRDFSRFSREYGRTGIE